MVLENLNVGQMVFIGLIVVLAISIPLLVRKNNKARRTVSLVFTYNKDLSETENFANYVLLVMEKMEISKDTPIDDLRMMVIEIQTQLIPSFVYETDQSILIKNLQELSLSIARRYADLDKPSC